MMVYIDSVMYWDGIAVKNRVSNAYLGPEKFTCQQNRVISPNVKVKMISEYIQS